MATGVEAVQPDEGPLTPLKCKPTEVRLALTPEIFQLEVCSEVLREQRGTGPSWRGCIEYIVFCNIKNPPAIWTLVATSYLAKM